MYSRFLYGWPTTPDYVALTDDIDEVDPAFKNLLTMLIRLPAEDEYGAFAPRTIPLSTGARATFEDYRKFVDREKRGIEGREQQWLSKSETHVLRLAGVLAYLAWADASEVRDVNDIAAGLEPDQIDARFMVDAIKLVREYFWPHARACLRQVGLSDRHRHARRLLRWCRANGRDELSLRDIRREALGAAIDVEETRALVGRLIAAGWLQALPIVMTGGRPRERWCVNPRLFEVAGTARSAESHHLRAVIALPAGGKTPKKRSPT